MTIDIERLKTDLDYWLSMAPEGATHYCIEQPCPWLREEPLSYFRLDQWVDYGTPKMGMEHIANAIPRPSPAWDGEGLPVEGTVCRMRLAFRIEDRITITYMGDGVFCYRAENGMEYTGSLSDAAFEPLKTEKERVVEAALIELSLVAGFHDRDREVAEALYDAGMLKEPTND